MDGGLVDKEKGTKWSDQKAHVRVRHHKMEG